MVLQAIPAIDYEEGRDMARGLLQVAVDLAALVREEADYDSIRRSAVLDG